MKKVLLTFFLLSANIILGQVVYKGSEDPDFIAMVKNGVTFLPSTNLDRSTAVLEALQKNWIVSPLKVYDSDSELSPDDIVVMETTIIYSPVDEEDILVWIKFGELEKNKNISKYKAIGYMSLNGFTGRSRYESITPYWDLAVKGFNDVAEVVMNENINHTNAKIFGAIYEKILPRVVALENKTLLMNNYISQYVDQKALAKYNIKYKIITFEDYIALTAEERAQSCVMYFAKNGFSDVSIFDLATNKLIYTRHYVNAKRKLTADDIEEISNIWNKP